MGDHTELQQLQVGTICLVNHKAWGSKHTFQMMSRGSTWSKPYNVSTNILHFHVVWVLVFHCSKCVCHILVVPYPPNNCNHHQPSMLGCHKIIGFPMKKTTTKSAWFGVPPHLQKHQNLHGISVFTTQFWEFFLGILHTILAIYPHFKMNKPC